VFGVQLATLSNFEQLELVYLGANSADLVREGELYRLITGNLLHAGFRHLAVNVIGILVLGAYVETLLGRARMQLIAVASALLGSVGSFWLEAASISVGASTIVFGLMGALAALIALRTRQLPRGVWLPAAFAVALALGDLVFPREQTDQGAHLGGFVAGLGTTALLLVGRPLQGISAQREGPVRIAALAATAVFCLGLGVGVMQVAQSDRSRVVRWVELRMLAPGAEPVAVNNLAYLLAVASEVQRPTLESARDAVLPLLQAAPASAPMWDTLAVLHYRLGDLHAALSASRNALTLDPSPPFAGRMARLEAEAATQAGGPLVRGDRVPSVGLRLEEDAVVLVFSELATSGVTVHALVLRGETMIGLAEFRLRSDSALEQRFALDTDYGDDVRFAVVLIDARSFGAEPDDSEFRVLELDPRMARLPAPLPPSL
jgi:membrane associated rhomboid family serine protease